MCLGTIAKPASNAVAAISQAQNALTHRGKRNHLFGRADGDGFAGHAEHHAAGFVLRDGVAARRMASMPAPSLPMPVRMTPMAFLPAATAAG